MGRITKGPWKRFEGVNGYVVASESDGMRVCKMEGPAAKYEANLHAISAVPEMLEALEMLKEQFEAEEADGHNRTPHLIIIDKALAKARGGVK